MGHCDKCTVVRVISVGKTWTMVDLDGIPYLDGGLADSIPVIHARKLGYEKNIIVLTQKKGYRKTVSRKNIALIRAKFRQYPELVRTICLRPFRYNKCLEAIEKWEAEEAKAAAAVGFQKTFDNFD